MLLVDALALAMLGLAALFPIEGAVLASGEVSVDSRVKAITHPNGGSSPSCWFAKATKSSQATC